MGFHLDMDSPIELPIERKQKGQLVKKHIIVKNHIREVFDNSENTDESTDIEAVALKTSDSNMKKRKSNAIETLEKQLNTSTDEITQISQVITPISEEVTPISEQTKDFNKLNKIYLKCKTILNRIEEKYGDKLRDVKKCEEENNLNLKRSYSSTRRVGYDKDGIECILNGSSNMDEWSEYTRERQMQRLRDDRLQHNLNQQRLYSDSRYYAERQYYDREEIPNFHHAGYEQNGYNFHIQHPLEGTVREERLFPDASHQTESEVINDHQIQNENRRIIYDDDGNTHIVNASLDVDNYDHIIQEYIQEKSQLQIEDSPILNQMTDNVRDLQQILQLPDLKMHERERVIQRLNQLKRNDSYEMRALKYGLVKKLKNGSAKNEVEFCGSNLDTILGYGHDSFL